VKHTHCNQHGVHAVHFQHKVRAYKRAHRLQPPPTCAGAISWTMICPIAGRSAVMASCCANVRLRRSRRSICMYIHAHTLMPCMCTKMLSFLISKIDWQCLSQFKRSVVIASICTCTHTLCALPCTYARSYVNQSTFLDEYGMQ
jgi:hypothetical protein